jgi:hypothetical protein
MDDLDRARFEQDRLDLAQLQKWVATSGMECVARVAALLTAPPRGPVAKPDKELLLEMAFRLRDDPMRTTNDVADEVAREAKDWRNPTIATASLSTGLARAFERNRMKWLLLAQSLGDAPRWSSTSTAHKKKQKTETRALGRIIEMLPESIDLYKMVLFEAKTKRPETVTIIKRLGRERVETMSGTPIAELQATPGGGQRNPPGNLLDLIDHHLCEPSQLARAAKVRRKSAK